LAVGRLVVGVGRPVIGVGRLTVDTGRLAVDRRRVAVGAGRPTVLTISDCSFMHTKYLMKATINIIPPINNA